jgi:predicted DNA-binding transcriptional regulator AlpA
MERDFLKVDDIVQMLGVSKSSAYRLMKRVRQELEEQGMITFPSVVPRHYFLQRMGVTK